MHRLVYALVVASSRESALLKGTTGLQTFVGQESNMADYWVTFDEDVPAVAGNGRWGDLPPVSRVDSDQGQCLLDRGRRLLEELECGELLCSEIGVFYGETGNTIRSQKDLDQLLAKNHADPLWIIPADLHY